MKIVLVLDDGTVFDEVEDVETYSLSHPVARGALVDEILGLIRRATA